MKWKKQITAAGVCFWLCFCVQQVQADPGTGIVVENPKTIQQMQLGTMRMEIQPSTSQMLEEILNGLEEVIPVEAGKQKELNRGDDFVAILLIRENGEKEKFFFFQEQDQWYMEDGDGTFYENVDFFVTEVIHVQKIDVKAVLTKDACQILLEGRKTDQLLDYAEKEGFYPKEKELQEFMENHLKDFRESPDYAICEKMCREEGTTLEQVIYEQKEHFLKQMVRNEFSKQRRMEFMEGQDTIGGKTYSDLNAYQEAYLDQYVYR